MMNINNRVGETVDTTQSKQFLLVCLFLFVCFSLSFYYPIYSSAYMMMTMTMSNVV